MKYVGFVSLGVGIGTAIGGIVNLFIGCAASAVSRLLIGSLLIGFGAALVGMTLLRGGDKDAKNR